MKKTLLSVFLSSFFVFGLFAQTNLDFETWTGNEPNGWISYNFLSQIGAPQSTFNETTDPGEGLSSAKMVTVNCTVCPNFGLPATLGGIVTGGIIGPPPAMGFAFTGRPTSIDFQYKANPATGDAGLVFVQLSRWDAGASQQVIIGQGYYVANTVVSTWTSNTIQMAYANADIPDTLLITSCSSAASAVQGLPNSGTPAVGSEFWVDSIVINDPCANSGLAVTVTGTNETVIGANDGTASASGTGGTPGYTYVWDNGATTANISGLAPGTYTVAIIDANGCATSGSYTVLAGAIGVFSGKEGNSFTVYPNPASTTLYLAVSGKVADMIFVYDVTGKNILRQEVSGDLTRISVQAFSEGIYFYNIKDKVSGNIQTGKFSVIK